MAKETWELKANVNSAEMAYGDKLIRLEADKPYETSDPGEQRALAEWPAAKKTEKGGK